MKFTIKAVLQLTTPVETGKQLVLTTRYNINIASQLAKYI